MSVFAYARPRVTRRHLSRRFHHAGLGTYAFLILFAAGSLFPLYWSLVVASHDNSAIAASPPVLTPGHELVHNIKRLFSSGEVNVNFWTALGNSALVASVVAASVVFFSALAGFAFAKLRFRGSKALMLTVVATMLVPTQLGVIPLYIEMIHLHWVNRLPAFMMTWNDFFWPLIVLTPGNPTVQVAVSTLASGYVEDFALVLTGTFISILPLLFVFVVLGRQIIGGIMQGAVKGGADVA